MDLLELFFPEYYETLAGNLKYLVHETYSKCLPAILEEGVSRMAKNNIHMSKTTGYAGLQRRRKPNISITIDVTKGKAGGLQFLHCANDVIMCPGNRAGFISPFFFHEIRNINTGALIEFIKPSEPAKEDEHIKGEDTEISLLPPKGATGFSHDKREEGSDLVPNDIHNQDTILHLVHTHPSRDTTQPDSSFQMRFLRSNERTGIHKVGKEVE